MACLRFATFAPLQTIFYERLEKNLSEPDERARFLGEECVCKNMVFVIRYPACYLRLLMKGTHFMCASSDVKNLLSSFSFSL